MLAMAPYINSPDSGVDGNVDVQNLKTKVGVSEVKLESKAQPPPVADDYMYDFKYNHALPTTDVLGVEIPADCDAQKEAQNVMASISTALSKGDAQGFTDLFIEYGGFASFCLCYSWPVEQGPDRLI
jgi:hypothetical protein